MATTKKYEIAVKIGSYVDETGANKNRYQNIGVVMQGDNGPYILLDPLINLAAVPREPGKDRVICSLFEPKARDSQQAQAPRQAQGYSAPQRQAVPDDSDVPF